MTDRTATIQFSDGFTLGSNLGAKIAISILVGLCVMMGFFLCILPAFLIAGLLMFWSRASLGRAFTFGVPMMRVCECAPRKVSNLARSVPTSLND